MFVPPTNTLSTNYNIFVPPLQYVCPHHPWSTNFKTIKINSRQHLEVLPLGVIKSSKNGPKYKGFWP